MYRAYAVINSSVIVLLIAWTYVANAIRVGGNTIGEVSDRYDTLLTPADYAFGIWGFIFLALLVHAGFQLKRAFGRGDDTFILQIGPWLTAANVFNAAWTWAWLSEYVYLSAALMVGILLSLFRVIGRLNMERWDAPFSLIAAVWWPISIYAGWISIATVANVASAFGKLGWGADAASEQLWTVAVIVLVVGANLGLIISRHLREFAAVTVWGLVAIAVRHWGTLPVLQWAAAAGALVLTIAILAQAFAHRTTLPFLRGLYGR